MCCKMRSWFELADNHFINWIRQRVDIVPGHPGYKTEDQTQLQGFVLMRKQDVPQKLCETKEGTRKEE